MQKLYIDNSTCYDNNKIQKDEDIILKKITLSKESETIFSNITNLINNISFHTIITTVLIKF